MSNLKINDLTNLNLSGSELFNDSESFLTELSDENEQIDVVGGSCILTLFRENPIVEHITRTWR